MATAVNTYFDNEGRAVDVALLYTIAAKDVVYIEGFLGISVAAGVSGGSAVVLVDHRAYQFTVPTGLAVAKGDTVYVDISDLTGHHPDDTAYSTTSGAGLIALFKAVEAKDANDVVIGILLPEGV